MADVLRMPAQMSFGAPNQMPNVGSLSLQPSPNPKDPSTSASVRNGHLNLDTFSRVNQNGSFEFDKVLKRGDVEKRVEKNRAWKSTWKPYRLVLRPNLLSIYKDEDEAELRASISLSDVTAVVAMRASKSKRENVFCVYTPSRNYYFQGLSASDTMDWVGRIRSEAHVDTLDEPVVTSPKERLDLHDSHSLSEHEIEDRSSSPDQGPMNLQMRRHRGGTHSSSQTNTRPRQISAVSQSHDFSGNEMTSYSDFSDTPGPSESKAQVDGPSNLSSIARPPVATRNLSQMSGLDVHTHSERVVWHGYLYYLRTKGGVRQWKKLWVVLRPRNLAFYKNDSEYSAVLIIPMSQIVNAAEIEPVSRSKKYCLQIIAEEKTYRFCAPDEDALTKWLGSLKSVLSKMNDPMRKASVV